MNTSILIKRVLLVKNRLSLISFTHHSYLVIGDRTVAIDFIRESIEGTLGLTLAGYPDFYLAEYDFFGVDDSRMLKQKVNARAFGGGRKFFIITIGATTTEAQNALLKVLEEPAGQAHIFLIARSEKIFLPTIVSRCEVVLVDSCPQESGVVGREFLAQSAGERIKTIAEWQKEEKLTKEFTSGLVDELEREIVARPGRLGLASLVKARRYIYDRALLPRLVLEYLAVALPEFSKTKTK